jgi:hypothetical protein
MALSNAAFTASNYFFLEVKDVTIIQLVSVFPLQDVISVLVL